MQLRCDRYKADKCGVHPCQFRTVPPANVLPINVPPVNVTVANPSPADRNNRVLAGLLLALTMVLAPVLCDPISGLSLIGSGAAHAQGTSKVDEIRTRQQAKQALLKWKRERANQLKTDVIRFRKERKRLNARLLETGRAAHDSERKLNQIEARLGELEAQEKILRGSLAQRHDVIAKLLAAMQRMGRNPPPVMITRRADALKMVRSAMLLAATFPELRKKALELAGKLNELTRVADASREQVAKFKLENARLADTRTRLSSLIAQKKQSIGQHQSQLVVLRREAVQIKKSVKGLGELIAKLDKAVAARTALGKYDNSRKLASNSAALAADRQPSNNVVIASAPLRNPLSPIQPRAGLGARTQAKEAKKTKKAKSAAPPRQPNSIVMAPRTDLAMVSPGRLKPAIPFRRAKGRLPLPAQGRQVVSFGEKTQYGARSKGIVIQTRHSAQVISPTDGWVVYAGEFRSYGQLLIINAGQDYHILLAGLSQIDVQLGQFVLAGEPVGIMNAASRRLKSRSKGNAPVLYIEFRKKGRPINPGPWWVKGSKKV